MKIIKIKKHFYIAVAIVLVSSVICWLLYSNQITQPPNPSRAHSLKISHSHNNDQLQDKTNIQKNSNKIITGPQLAKMNKKMKIQVLKFAILIDQFEKLKLSKATEQSFAKILAVGLDHFPKKADIQKLSPDKVHTIPVPISLAGEYMGHLKLHLDKEPKLITAAMDFYSNCALSKEIMLSVKALCLANLANYSKSLGQQLNYSPYEKQVIELAKYAEMTD